MTKKRLFGLLIATFAFFVFLPSISFAKGGSASMTLIVSGTIVNPVTIKVSSVAIKGITSKETSNISYNATSVLPPVIEVKKGIIKGQFVEIVTVTF